MIDPCILHKSKPFFAVGRKLNRKDAARLNKYVDIVTKVSESDSEEVIADKRRKAQDMLRIKTRYLVSLDFYNNGRRASDVPPCRAVPEILNALGIGYRELIDITASELSDELTPEAALEQLTSKKLGWACELDAAMCKVCDSLDDFDRRGLYENMAFSVPEMFWGIFFNPAEDKDKLSAIVDNDRRNGMPIFTELCKDTVMNNLLKKRGLSDWGNYSLSFGKYPLVVKVTGASPHWLLGLDENHCVLAESGVTELIMDVFCLLDESWKTLYYDVALRLLKVRETESKIS